MDNLITEFWKIKRYSVIKAGAYQRCARCYYESAPAFPRNVSIQHYDRHGADHSHKYFNLPFGTSTHYYQYISFWK